MAAYLRSAKHSEAHYQADETTFEVFGFGEELIVEGTLDLRGTGAAPAIFTSDRTPTPVPGDWYGIRLTDTADTAATVHDLVVEFAVGQFDRDPDADSVSMDPSDGGGWCECDRCAELGRISDRALLLANEGAAGVNAKYPGKLVGMYAYNYHSPPPSIKPHAQVVVSVATAFLKGGLTLDEIIDGWSERGTALGIREYYSVFQWDWDFPDPGKLLHQDH